MSVPNIGLLKIHLAPNCDLFKLFKPFILPLKRPSIFLCSPILIQICKSVVIKIKRSISQGQTSPWALANSNSAVFCLFNFSKTPRTASSCSVFGYIVCTCNDLGPSTLRRVKHRRPCEMVLFKTVDLGRYLFKSLDFFFLVP